MPEMSLFRIAVTIQAASKDDAIDKLSAIIRDESDIVNVDWGNIEHL